MTSIEASVLLGTIEGQSTLRPVAHQIGNGEWVVIVNHVWLWTQDDWDEHKYAWAKTLYSWRRR